MSGHVMDLEDLVMKMKSANCGSSKEDVCAVMLRSLPASYESLVQAFRMSVTSFDSSCLVRKLIAEEVRQKEAARVEEATALLTSNRSSKQPPRSSMDGVPKGRQERVVTAARLDPTLGIAVRDAAQTKEMMNSLTSHLMRVKDL
ncbi:unnamed protein product [Peronospora destructor]|nr:unnamed protein product [Peronospora destructor]